MSNPWKKRALEFNKRRAEESEAAADMKVIAEKISQLPPGQIKRILDEDTLAILRKYGVNA